MLLLKQWNPISLSVIDLKILLEGYETWPYLAASIFVLFCQLQPLLYFCHYEYTPIVYIKNNEPNTRILCLLSRYQWKMECLILPWYLTFPQVNLLESKFGIYPWIRRSISQKFTAFWYQIWFSWVFRDGLVILLLILSECRWIN